MVLADLALGIGGNLATNVVLFNLERVRNTKVGKALQSLGVLTPDFEITVKTVIVSAYSSLLAGNPEYNLKTINSFLTSEAILQEVIDYILDGDPVDAELLIAGLADAVKPTKRHDTDVWPRGIQPDKFTEDFIKSLDSAISKSEAPALASTHSQIRKARRSLEALSVQVSEFHKEIPSLFDASLKNSQKEEWKNFEKRYIAHVMGRFGRMSTPGVRDLHGVKQELSVAYISLNVKAGAKAEPIRAEAFLRDNARIVVRGPAGSGKTTLLSYLAWSCCQNDQSGSPWAGGVPFIVPLRTIARTENGSPHVERFVDYSVDRENWAAQTPSGWIEDVLISQRRAIIMIDGVDELPAARRPAFWDWLTRFIETYPDARVIVTSRVLPGTMGNVGPQRTDEWNPPNDFVDAHLDEMSDLDILKFVEHWHDAVDQTKLESSDIAELRRARDELPKKLSDPINRRIRELCSTPLLCAMVCVLHWREEGYLPRQRVELYDRCCEMLIEARDLKRQIMLPAGPTSYLTKNDKERVLQRLAFEMMSAKPDGDENESNTYRIEISRSKALQWIDPCIPAFQRQEARHCSNKQILDYLIERTGLLREPAGGLVDFPHRTFQEYLAACAAGASGREDVLAARADDDQWHETIMLAAGTPTGGVRFGHDLVEALIKRAERHKSARPKSQKIRKTCFALALGCIENLRQPDPELRDRVLGRLSEIVPPSDDSDAKVLAVAGDAAVPYLSHDRWKDERTQVLAACAQTLRLIGSNQAKRALGHGYIEEKRESVIAQICRTGEIPFNQIPLVVDYVAERGVLPFYAPAQDLSLLVGLQGLKEVEIQSPTPKNLDYVHQFDGLQKIHLNGCNLDDLSDVRWPDNIIELVLTYCSGDDLSWIENLPGLRKLQIEAHRGPITLDRIGRKASLAALGFGRTKIEDIDSIRKFTSIREIAFSACRELSNLNVIGSIEKIEKLKILNCPISDWEFLENLRSLEVAEFAFVRNLNDTRYFRNCKNLRLLRLSCQEINNLSGLTDLPLKKLIIAGLAGSAQLDPLSTLTDLKSLTLAHSSIAGNLVLPPNIQELSIRSAHYMRSLAGVDSAKALEHLHITGARKLKDISMLGDLKNLTTIRIYAAPKLENFAPLEMAESLEAINLFNCDSLENISFATGLRRLAWVTIARCDALSDLTPLSSLESLRGVEIMSCRGIVDFSSLTHCQNLQYLRTSPMGSNELKIPEALLAKSDLSVDGYEMPPLESVPFYGQPYLSRSRVRQHSNLLDFDRATYTVHNGRMEFDPNGVLI